MRHLSTLIAILVVVVVLRDVDAKCCYSWFSRCGDCSRPTFYCEVGRCNIFGCNCDGGCRRGRCFQEIRGPQNSDTEPVDFDSTTSGVTDEPDSNTVDNIIMEADTDKNGLVDLAEARNYLTKSASDSAEELDVDRFQSEFNKLDSNKDGYLESKEIDPDQTAQSLELKAVALGPRGPRPPYLPRPRPIPIPRPGPFPRPGK